MKYYFVTSTYFDFKQFYVKFDNDQGPRHAFFELGKWFEGEVLQPDSVKPNLVHRLLSVLISEPEHWALAASIARNCASQDTIYCAGEDVCIPLAIHLKLTGRQARLASFFMNPDSVRVKLFIKLFSLDKLIGLITVTDKNKKERLKQVFGIHGDKISVLPEQTDQKFFNPGVGTIEKKNFLIASAGMEQRDYTTLAAAVYGLDLEVKICAHSPNLNAKTRYSLPQSPPGNMEIRYYEFADLRDLYRSADVVVICLLENQYSAGLTVLMEAIACKKPVIITDNIGLGRDFIEKDLVIGVNPNDAENLRSKIMLLMDNPEIAKDYSERAYDYFQQFHTCEAFLESLAEELKSFPVLR